MNVPEPERRHAALRETVDTRTLLVAIVALALFVYLTRFILLPFVITGIIAYLCTPLLDWLATRTRLPRALLAVLLFLVLTGTATLAVMVAGRRLVAEVVGTVTDLQATLDHLLQQASGDHAPRLFGQTIDAAAIVGAAGERLHAAFGQPDLLVAGAGYGIAALIGLFLTVALLCYFLVAGKSAARGLLWVVPPRRRALVVQIGMRLDPALKRYFLGMLAIVIYSTIVAYVGLGIVLGIDHAALLALLTGVLETIPFIGTTAAPILAGLVSLHTATGLGSILAFALYAVLLRLSIDQVFAPLVLGKAAHVHPVLIIFSVLTGSVLFGVVGAILAVPTALAVKATLATLYDEDVA